MDLPAARKLLGAAIGMCPKEKLFKGYIQLELDVSAIFTGIVYYDGSLTKLTAQLREFDRVRQLYKKYIEVIYLCTMTQWVTDLSFSV